MLKSPLRLSQKLENNFNICSGHPILVEYFKNPRGYGLLLFWRKRLENTITVCILLYFNALGIPYFMQSERIGGMFIPFEERRRKIGHPGNRLI